MKKILSLNMNQNTGRYFTYIALCRKKRGYHIYIDLNQVLEEYEGFVTSSKFTSYMCRLTLPDHKLLQELVKKGSSD